jgi:hypothetical protein
MKFIVQAQTGHTTPLPATLTTVDPIPERESAGTRYFNFVNVSEDCAGGEWIIQTLDGPDPARDTVIGEHWDDIDAFPVLGTTEVWEFINDSSMMHPMHVHLVQFQILDRCAFDGGGDGRGDCETLAPHEAGTWKDTVRVSPGTRVRVIMRFENYPGKFPAHCHLLDHEDHEMMRQFQTTWDPDLAVVDGICGPQEDCISNPDDCGTVPGNFCGNALCEIGDGEDFNNCPQDCNGSVVVGSQFNCGSDDPGDPGYNCGFDTDGYTVLDDRCITNGYFCRVKARVPACCGDSLCEGQETAANCATDCEVCTITEDPEVSCTDGEDNDCDGLVDGADPDCPDVCGDIKEKALCNDTPGCEWQGGKRSGMCVSICTITEDPEVSCFDNVDNDCDEATDCADTDCDLDAGPETTCGVGECAATGNLTCMGGAEVDTCTPGDPVPEVCDDPGMLDEDCDGYANEDDLDDCEVCQPTTNREGRDSSLECFDGEDNDCDTFLDCADPDCDGIKDSACDTGVPGICSIGELTCTGGAPECVQVVDPDVEGPFGDGTCDDGLDNDCDGLTDEAEDPDCQPPGIPCSDHTTRDECRNDPNCRWKKGDCINR